MHLGLHHRARRYSTGKGLVENKGIVRAVDAATYAISFVMLSFTVHQVWIIWSEQDASGVSLIAWVAYLLGAIVWTAYGYVHADRVILITNFLWVIFSVLVVIGVTAFGS